ncbi:MAG TPA: hypothetical protein VK495_13010 [Steroidobacteraceae bacterium]|nr:hypothetical protein [Steroidobacteraceae bacterium]
MLKVVALLSMLALMSACATHPKTTASRPAAIKRIAIIPASNPKLYSFENAAPPIGGYPFQYWVNKADSKSKAKIFNGRLNSPPGNLGDQLTAEVATALRGQGFTVEILEGLARPADDPDNVDYDKISSNADAILHLWISEVGLYSSGFSLDYIPRVNAGGKLFVKGQDNIYNEDIYYGVDARKGKEWAIVPDAKYAYRSFELVMSNIDELRSAYATGVLEISRRMSEQIYRATKNLAAEESAQTKLVH